jgi:hypothetical protein
METLDIVLKGLMARYTERVPDVKISIDAMLNAGIISDASEIENDHVAFRTLGVPNLGIASFEKIFLKLGYTKRDYFRFEGKKLNAYWYAPPAENYPRIFMSELCVNELSETAQNIIYKYTKDIVSDPVDDLDLTDGKVIDVFLHSPLWALPTWHEYHTLLQESEYAAWVIYNRYYLNHYTISVHNLGLGYDDIYTFNTLLKNAGIRLNDSGGEVKISPDGGLLQSSTVAKMIDAVFSDGTVHSISGSYVEFAQRNVLPEFKHLDKSEIQRIHRRDGFETGNADKIFESTFISQTNK